MESNETCEIIHFTKDSSTISKIRKSGVYWQPLQFLAPKNGFAHPVGLAMDLAALLLTSFDSEGGERPRGGDEISSSSLQPLPPSPQIEKCCIITRFTDIADSAYDDRSLAELFLLMTAGVGSSLSESARLSQG